MADSNTRSGDRGSDRTARVGDGASRDGLTWREAAQLAYERVRDAQVAAEPLACRATGLVTLADVAEKIAVVEAGRGEATGVWADRNVARTTLDARICLANALFLHLERLMREGRWCVEHIEPMCDLVRHMSALDAEIRLRDEDSRRARGTRVS